MKKIIISLIIFLTILFGSVNFSSADDNYKGQPVFKIFNYSLDKLNGIYVLDSYGSALYLGDGIILTNEHVIKGSNDNYDGFYEVCETRNFKKSPVCFSAGQLLYYDKAKDLALLKLNKKPSTNKKISFSSKELNIGDNVITYGYPSNGGVTITYTSGKISGFSGGRYKIDASIDSGSSGGGAFDSEGKLLGITTSIISNHTTLGYLVTVNDIKSFLIKSGNIVDYGKKLNNDFVIFLDKYQKNINSTNINSDYFTLNNIDKYGFNIYENITNKSGDAQVYLLESETGDTIIKIKKFTFNTDKKTWTAEEQNKFFNIFKKKNTIAQEIKINNKKVIYFIEYDDKKENIEITFNINSVEYTIEGNMSSKKELKEAINLFINELHSKEKSIKNILKLNGITIGKNTKINIIKSFLDGYDLTVLGIKNTSNSLDDIFMLKTLKYVAPKGGFKLKETIKKLEKNYNGIKNIYFRVFKDLKGNIYFYTKMSYSDITKHNLEVVKQDGDILYSYNFIFITDKKSDSNILIKNFIKEIDFDLKTPYSKEELAIINLKIFYEIDFSNNYNSPLFGGKIDKNELKQNITKEKGLKILEDIIGKKYFPTGYYGNNKLNLSTKNLSEIELKLNFAKNNLSKTKLGRKYLDKFEKFIPKLKTEKLIKVSNKLKTINLNNSKFKKYKDILEYLKFKILVELENRN